MIGFALLVGMVLVIALVSTPVWRVAFLSLLKLAVGIPLLIVGFFLFYVVIHSLSGG